MKLFLLIATLLLPSTQSVMENLVRLYRGDGDLQEATGSNDHLTKKGSTPVAFEDAIISGRNRKVFSFDGTTSMYAHTVGSTGIPGEMDERTIAIWLNMNCCLLHNHPMAGYGIMNSKQMFGFTSGFRAEAFVIEVYHNDEFSDGTHGTFGKEFYINGEWVHLAATMADRFIKVYVNGIKVKEGRTLEPFNTKVPGEIWVGGPGKAYASFNGKMADFAIFDKALSDENIKDIFKFGFSDNGDLSTPPPPPDFFDIYNITTVAQSSTGNEMQFQYSFGPNVTHVEIDILEKNCTNAVLPSEIIIYNGTLSNSSLSYTPEVNMNSVNFTFELDTTKLSDGNINILSEGSSTTKGSLEFCIKVNAFDDSLSLLSNSPSDVSSISLTSIKTSYKVDFDGNNEFYGPFQVDATLQEAEVIDGPDGDLSLQNLTVKSYLCSAEDIAEVPVGTEFSDFIYLCVTPEFNDQVVDVKSLEVSYTTSTKFTMVLKDETFEADFIDVSQVSDVTKLLQKIRIPVLAAFLEDGNTDLTFSGNAFVSFSTSDRAKATNVVEFGVAANLAITACDLLFQRVKDFFGGN